MVGWWVGDVLRHPDGRTGQVVGIGIRKVVVRLPDGTLETWTGNDMRGTGLWLAVKCRCGHSAEAHEHHRRGRDCSACECPRFKKPRRRLW